METHVQMLAEGLLCRIRNALFKELLAETDSCTKWDVQQQKFSVIKIDLMPG